MDKNTMPYTDEERIAHFFREVGQEFELRAGQQEKQLEQERNQAIKQAKQTLENELKYYKAEKIGEFMFENSRKASREILDLKHESLSIMEELLGDIKALVRERLVSFVKSEAYYDYLLSCCKKAAEYVGEGFELHMSHDDCEKYAKRIYEDLGREFTPIADEQITIGGARLCRNDMGITVDVTLDERLASKMEELAKTGV